MRKGFLAGVLCGFVLFNHTQGQEVVIVRETKAKSSERPATLPQETKPEIARIEKAVPVQPTKPSVREQASVPAKPTIEQMRKSGSLAAQRVKEEMHEIEPSDAAPARAPQASKQTSAGATHPADRQSREPESIPSQPVSFSGQTAFTRLADGFDLPVGKPDGQGYYKARGFRSNGHLGEDWDGVGGGDTDLGDPIYCIGDGVVVFARDCHMGWGNVVIVRHAFREGGMVRNVDSLYGHLEKILVRRGQAVRRGQQIATMGTAHGLYDAHLHLEIRKNIEIGMSRAKFAQDLSNYYDPSQFILSHRHLQTSGASSRIAMNTFTQDANIRWDKARNYSHAHSGGGSSESAAALKKALAAQTSH